MRAWVLMLVLGQKRELARLSALGLARVQAQLAWERQVPVRVSLRPWEGPALAVQAAAAAAAPKPQSGLGLRLELELV